MAERDIEELVVRMKGEGTEETAEALDETGDEFEETADQSEDAAEDISENADVWDRAMNVIVTGLAVASAGLLSMVPVIGEVFAGLLAIIEAVAFHMDAVLRPVLQPVTDLLYGLADAIYTAEGAWGTLIGIIGTAIAIIAGVLGAIALVNAIFGTSITITGILSGIFYGLAGAVAFAAGVLGVSVGAFLAIVAAIIAVIGIIAILITDYKGLRTALIRETVKLGTTLIRLYNNLKRKLLGTLAGLVSGAISKFVEIKDGAKEVIGNLIDDAKKWGKRVIKAFIAGIKRVASSISSTIETQVTDRVEGTVVGKLIGGASSTVNLDPRDKVSAPNRGDSILNIDGRDVTSALGRFRKDGPLSRGR